MARDLLDKGYEQSLCTRKEQKMNIQLAAGIILILVFVLFGMDVFPVALTSMIGMVAMVVCGVISYQDGFGSFGSSATMIVCGMMIVAEALLKYGLSEKARVFSSWLARKGERNFSTAIMLLGGFLSVFMMNAPLVALFMSIISSIEDLTGGAIKRKNCFMPMIAGILIGGASSMIGCTATQLGSTALVNKGFTALTIFQPALPAIAALIICAAAYWLFIYKWQLKWFNFESEPLKAENDTTMPEEAPAVRKRKGIISILVFVGCITFFIIQPPGFNMGTTAIVGAMILIITKCVDARNSLKNMMWPALITLSATQAIANGVVGSGLGETIVYRIIDVMGGVVYNWRLMVFVFLFLAWFLSLFMADGALVMMLSTIAVSLSLQVGTNPVPWVLACIYGGNLAMATPMATSSATMIQVAGYRFKDYVKMGTCIGVIGGLVCCFMIIFLYT